MANELNNENYFNTENNMKYMSASQFKDFEECEVEALAKAKGEYIEEKSNALLFGSYVDAYFSNELEQFKANNPDMFNSKTGELKAPFKNIEDVIKATENDKLLMEYLSGKKQVVMTGEIAGVPFKIKVDSLLDYFIVDQKIIASINERVWVEDNGKNVKVDFIQAFGYAIQGAIYQEVVRQNTGKTLPFVLAVTTKEENPDKALINIDQDVLDISLERVKEKAPRYDLIKKGKIKPIGCGKCACCRKDKVLTEVVSYKELFNLNESENVNE